MARGFSQQEGENYDETFAPVIAIISLATFMGWSLHQMDVKTSFLNGVIEEEVYIEQPQGFEVHLRETHVCKRPCMDSRKLQELGMHELTVT